MNVERVFHIEKYVKFQRTQTERSERVSYFLYIRKGVKIRSFVHGGAQERKRRAGTENVPGIVGYGKAAEIAAKTMK